MQSILLLTAAAAAAGATPAPPHIGLQTGIGVPFCRNASAKPVTNEKAVRAQKLNELPNANHYLALFRTEDGCHKPVIVRYDIGSAPHAR